MASFAEYAPDFIAEDLITEGGRTMDPFAQRLQMEVLWANAQEAGGVMHVSPAVLNPYGTVHGGCLMALADTVAGHNMAAAGKLCVTQSSAVSFLRAARGPTIHCRSKIQKLGKAISVVSVEETDESGNLLTTALFTFHTMKEIPPHIITVGDKGENSSGT